MKDRTITTFGLNPKGFSLLEVIVAITILGMGITLVAQLVSIGLRSAIISQKYVKAVTYAESKLGEISLDEGLEEGTETGDFLNENEYRWEVEIIPYNKEGNNNDDDYWVKLYKIRVSVFFKHNKDEKKVDLTTLRVQMVKSEEII